MTAMPPLTRLSPFSRRARWLSGRAALAALAVAAIGGAAVAMRGHRAEAGDAPRAPRTIDVIGTASLPVAASHIRWAAHLSARATDDDGALRKLAAGLARLRAAVPARELRGTELAISAPELTPDEEQVTRRAADGAEETRTITRGVVASQTVAFDGFDVGRGLAAHAAVVEVAGAAGATVEEPTCGAEVSERTRDDVLAMARRRARVRAVSAIADLSGATLRIDRTKPHAWTPVRLGRLSTLAVGETAITGLDTASVAACRTGGMITATVPVAYEVEQD